MISCPLYHDKTLSSIFLPQFFYHAFLAIPKYISMVKNFILSLPVMRKHCNQQQQYLSILTVFLRGLSAEVRLLIEKYILSRKNSILRMKKELSKQPFLLYFFLHKWHSIHTWVPHLSILFSFATVLHDCHYFINQSPKQTPIAFAMVTNSPSGSTFFVF